MHMDAPGTFKMSNPIFKQIKEDILLTQKIVKVPNDPDLSGTSDWQDRKPLSPENSLILSLFLNFLDRSEVFCPDVFPSSSIAGLYLLDHTLFFVWDEWVESDVSVVIFAQATSAELAKDYL